MTYSADLLATIPPDVHSLLTEWLIRDTELSSLVGDRIFAGPYPDGTELPAIKFLFPNASALAPPSMNVWTFTGQVDVHADTPGEAREIMNAVLLALVKIEGSSHEQGTLISMSPWNFQTTTDSSWSPPKFQQIVAVTLTARSK